VVTVTTSRRTGVIGAAAVLAGLLVTAAVVGCGTAEGPEPAADSPRRSSAAPTRAGTPWASPTTADPSRPARPSAAPSSTAPVEPVSLPAYFDRDFDGGGLRFGQVRERTASYTSYDVTYRSERWRISGVLNVPRGEGPFPAVVLAHGWIDRDAYVRGQGMTRERGYLADSGYIALHVDYRNHAESDRDPGLVRNFYYGYAVDVINAVNALRSSDRVPVAGDRVAVMGRSMGGSVVYQVLEMAPDLVSAGVAYAPQSSLEADNYRTWGGPGTGYLEPVVRENGLPRENPRFWREASTRTYLDRIQVPVLIQQGGFDDQCDPVWARQTVRAMQAVGVDVTLRWYPREGHAFGPRFDLSMRRTVAFLDRQLT
jgi:dipeptidyl aminopeptidase/acylaminoacyl peptidase